MFGQYAPNQLVLPTRRRFLQRAGLGLGSVALGTLLHEASAAPVNPLAARPPLYPARAKRMVWLFMTGDRKSTRLNSSHIPLSRMPSSA